ncbi:MAG: hypothetical protein JO042_12940 [Sinobacteraceae bacterium]|nr:hypothetical protein [Nevskiaceae bacterium]
MRAKISVASPEATLTRLLDALEQELIGASDDEILEAAKELGMNPKMKGSAAFLGLKYGSVPRPEDFFDVLSALPQDEVRRFILARQPRNKKGSREN